jgi:hypothetical protein
VTIYDAIRKSGGLTNRPSQISGSAFSINIVVPQVRVSLLLKPSIRSENILKDQLKVTGTPKTFLDTTGDRNPVLRSFCETCGCSLFSDIAAMPGFCSIKGGTVDNRVGVFFFSISEAVGLIPFSSVSRMRFRSQRNSSFAIRNRGGWIRSRESNS